MRLRGLQGAVFRADRVFQLHRLSLNFRGYLKAKTLPKPPSLQAKYVVVSSYAPQADTRGSYRSKLALRCHSLQVPFVSADEMPNGRFPSPKVIPSSGGEVHGWLSPTTRDFTRTHKAANQRLVVRYARCAGAGRRQGPALRSRATRSRGASSPPLQCPDRIRSLCRLRR